MNGIETLFSFFRIRTSQENCRASLIVSKTRFFAYFSFCSHAISVTDRWRASKNQKQPLFVKMSTSYSAIGTTEQQQQQQQHTTSSSASLASVAASTVARLQRNAGGASVASSKHTNPASNALVEPLTDPFIVFANDLQQQLQVVDEQFVEVIRLQQQQEGQVCPSCLFCKKESYASNKQLIFLSFNTHTSNSRTLT